MEPLSRLTPATADVLAVLLDADEEVWGLLLVKATGRPAGSVYPILERLERLGWLSSRWEDDDTRPGPRRRLYRLAAEAVPAARAARARQAAAVRSSPREATA